MTKEVFACEPLRIWNRLEPRPRTRDFGLALRAEVFDPLWMLTRQWQFGELKGEEAGTAITVSVATRTSPVVGVLASPGGASGPVVAAAYDVARDPLEQLVEYVAPSFDVAARARFGERALGSIASAARQAGVAFDEARYRGALARLFPIALPATPTDPGEAALFHADRLATPRRSRMERVLAGRAIDGVALFAALPAAGVTVARLPAGLVALVEPALLGSFAIGLERHRAWFAATWRSGQPSSWDSERLEYSAACTVRRHDTEWTLSADEYPGGTLDWYAFDIAGATPVSGGADPTTVDTFTAIARPAEFAGMPRARFWELEDGAVDIGNAPADTTDLAKTVIAEFCLLYGNNWLVVPCPVRPGTLVEVDGILVTDVFGQRSVVRPSNHGSLDWSSWDFFSLARQSISATQALGAHLFVPPKPPAVQESDSIEEVTFTRDEGANLVWAIERVIPDGIGGGVAGLGYGQSLRHELEKMFPPVVAMEAAGAVVDYQIMNRFPEHWIPFLPARLPGSTVAIRLQRASMPRTLGDRVVPVRPRAELLRAGIRGLMQDRPYFIREEEVPRNGVSVSRTYQRTRWSGGRTCVWFGHRREPGRGEGMSGLVFDCAVDRQPRR